MANDTLKKSLFRTMIFLKIYQYSSKKELLFGWINIVFLYLQDNKVEYNDDEAPKEGPGTRCVVQLQRETPEGLMDSTCGLAVERASLCR